MHSARLLVIKAHPDMAHAPRKRILISSFIIGLYDRHLASSLAVVKIQTAANATRLTAKGEAVSATNGTSAAQTTFCLTKQASLTPRFLKSLQARRLLKKKKTSSWQLLKCSTRFEGFPIQARTTQNNAEYGCGQYSYFKSDCC